VKSLVLTNNGFQIADTPIPPLLPGYVRIEVRSVGVSRTDLKIWKGEIEVKLPMILGHEIAGIVHESSIPDLAVGVPVTTEVDISCGSCWHCTHKAKHLCNSRETLGVTVDGGLAEYISVPYELIHTLPDPIDSVTGTFVEPLSKAIDTYTRTTVEPDESVLIVGTGKLGLLISQVYDAFGANVYLFGDNPWHLGVARQLGLRNTLQEGSNWKRKLLDETQIGPAVVVEATGSSAGLDLALSTVRSGGKVALTGRSVDEYTIDPEELIRRDISLIGTSSGDYKMAIEMLQKGRIEVKRLVSAQYPLEQATQAFEDSQKPEVVKVNIRI
jgi:alcohol dehydrogenase